MPPSPPPASHSRPFIVWSTTCIRRSAMLDRVAGQLERYMDLLSARQKLVASNIANADTPGYLTQDLDFQAELRNASGRMPQVSGVAGLKIKNDGNDVSLDRESRLLAENALRFQVASQLMKSQIRAVRSAIQEGKS
uniref:Flagellar basal-body rod protein FlgB n=1 Tax=Solibacter usitatus (strain Ellin6076) TaxID=234267 RepID=Q02C67_SOLUE